MVSIREKPPPKKKKKFLMNKLSLAMAALAVGTVSASAADLAARPYTKAPAPIIAAAYDWSGFYLGLNGGGAWSRKCWDIQPVHDHESLCGHAHDVAGPEGCHTASGGTVGGQVGYRWQSAAWVFGVEAQGNWANLSGSISRQNALFAGNPYRKPQPDRCDRSVHRAGRIFLEHVSALREGRRCRHTR